MWIEFVAPALEARTGLLRQARWIELEAGFQPAIPRDELALRVLLLVRLGPVGKEGAQRGFELGLALTLRGLAELVDAELIAVERAIARVEPRPNLALGLCGSVAALLRALGFTVEVALGTFLDLAGRPDASPLFGPEVPGAARPLVFHGGTRVARSSLDKRTIWLNGANLLVVMAIETFVRHPMLAALSLVAAIVGHLDDPPEPAALVDAVEAIEAAADTKGQ